VADCGQDADAGSAHRWKWVDDVTIALAAGRVSGADAPDA